MVYPEEVRGASNIHLRVWDA